MQEDGFVSLLFKAFRKHRLPKSQGFYHFWVLHRLKLSFFAGHVVRFISSWMKSSISIALLKVSVCMLSSALLERLSWNFSISHSLHPEPIVLGCLTGCLSIFFFNAKYFPFLSNFFFVNQGSYAPMKASPFLTPAHKDKRLEFCHQLQASSRLLALDFQWQEKI